ncbi:MAG: flavodoxin family protein [Christensenellales bacterium]|jgi:multimeric flavodoxin WrbA
MKVLALNGSPRKQGNTYTALNAAAQELQKEGIEVEIINIGARDISGCKACGGCEDGVCAFADEWFREMTQKIIDADGLILGSPVYYASINGTMKSFLDRTFYQRGMKTKMRHKFGASVAICRRAGSVATFDHLNHYLLISEMIAVGSSYWNMGIAGPSGSLPQDEEGIRTMRRLGQNMAWLLKMKEYSKDAIREP